MLQDKASDGNIMLETVVIAFDLWETRIWGTELVIHATFFCLVCLVAYQPS